MNSRRVIFFSRRGDSRIAPTKRIVNYGIVYNSFAHGDFETGASLPAIIQRWRVWQSAAPQYPTIPHF